MRIATIGTLFAGFGGVDIGAMAAGLTPLWAIEYDKDIAGVYAQNIGNHVTVADILDINPRDFTRVDVLHASPPCPNFSIAKSNRQESDTDIALGEKVAEFITVLRPPIFTLENVYGYRKAKSFKMIHDALKATGYQVAYWHLNSADYGVPQTRKRLMLVATVEGQPTRAHQTHAHPEKITPLLDGRKPWVGWYEAIEDLIPALPESQFAPWQLRRLSKNLLETLDANGFAVDSKNSRPGSAARGENFLTIRKHDEPPWTLQSQMNTNHVRCFVVDGKVNDRGRTVTTRDGEEPFFTITTSHNSRDIKGFIADLTNPRKEGITTRDAAEDPHHTVRAIMYKALPRAHVAGRVVKMTPRALARFQSFPDWYNLPEDKTLACKGIGNAVPPLMYQRVIEAQINRKQPRRQT